MQGTLLNRCAKDINVPVRVAVQDRSVESDRVLAELFDRGECLLVELDLLEVILDSLGSDALGDDGVAADLGPGEDDVGTGDGPALLGGEALSDSLDVGVVDVKGLVDRVVAEGGVGGDVDVVLGAVVDELGLG